MNVLLFHRELGIKVGFSRFSCRRCQKINDGISSTPTVSAAIFPGIAMLCTPLDITLKKVIRLAKSS